MEKLNAYINRYFKSGFQSFPESTGRVFCNILFFPFCSKTSKKYIKYMENLYQDILTGSLTAIGYGIIFGFFLGIIIYLISLNK